MKKLFTKHAIFIITAIILLCSLGGCDLTGFTPTNPKYDVTFISDGKFYLEIEVESGGYVYAPVQPTKYDHVFDGWHSDYECENDFSFPAQITEDVVLYADFIQNSHSENTCEVTFKVGSETFTTDTVTLGDTVKKPTSPTKTNHLFLTWCTDSALNNEYDFSKTVTEPLTLYAKFTIDAASITNTVTTEIMRSVVKIYNQSYNASYFGQITSSSTSQGSGVIFKEDADYFYLLTNCHVATKKSGYTYQQLTVEDYRGNQFDAELVCTPVPDYDLACLRFAKNTYTNAAVLEFAESDASIGDDVIALGAPNGQTNAISFGKYKDDVTATLSDSDASLSNVTFSVIKHDAYINNGSSGGPLINADLKIVGINYAGAEDTSYGLAIPLSKVKEFVNTYLS